MDIVMLSGGKDSTAMLLRMLEENWPIDEVLMVKTGKDFPELDKHLEKLEANTGIKIHYLYPKYSFDYQFAEIEIKHTPEFIEKHGNTKGRGWAGPHNRWCNGKIKVDLVDKYINKLKREHPGEPITQYIGIAADEGKRIENPTNKTDSVSIKRLPLVEWGMTEAECLQYCYDRGYDWDGLYTWSNRLSCWCCPLTTVEGWRGLYHHKPDLWEQVIEMDSKAWNCLKDRNTAAELDLRFQLEDKFIAEGKEAHRKPFFDEYKRLKAMMPTRKTKMNIGEME